MREITVALLFVLFATVCFGQNVGISNPLPSEKLHVDSGNIKIGKAIWSSTNKSFLKFGDGDYATIGEEEADDKLTIRAKELFLRPSTSYTTVPLSIQGSTNYSHFFFGTNEDTYIRAGKNNGNVIINDISGGRVGIGMSSPRAPLEQNGVVGTTAAIFGGEGSGISLQRNWPVVGFNHYYDGVNHKSIGQGWSAILGVNQNNGNMYIAHFNGYAAIPNANLTSYTERIYFSRFGKVGIGAIDPYADIEIVQRPHTFGDEDVDMGITYTGQPNYGSGIEPSYWNTHVGYGSDGGSFANTSSYSIWHKESGHNSNNWYLAAAIAWNGYYFQPSDIKLKKDINYLGKNYLLKVMLLKPASYHYITDDTKLSLSYGFIAQDLEKVFPEMVMTTKTNKLVSYSSLIPVLTAGIQEQQQQIEMLQKENADLNVRLEKLEKILIKK